MVISDNREIESSSSIVMTLRYTVNSVSGMGGSRESPRGWGVILEVRRYQSSLRVGAIFSIVDQVNFYFFAIDQVYLNYFSFGFSLLLVGYKLTLFFKSLKYFF